MLNDKGSTVSKKNCKRLEGSTKNANKDLQVNFDFMFSIHSFILSSTVPDSGMGVKQQLQRKH